MIVNAKFIADLVKGEIKGDPERPIAGVAALRDAAHTGEVLELNEEDMEAESDTVGGWTIERFGSFPSVGDSFEYENITLTVLEMSDGRRVDKVLVKAKSVEENE